MTGIFNVLLRYIYVKRKLKKKKKCIKFELLGTQNKLQALVYDILPSTTAVFSYAIGSRKLSANEQFFVGAQTAVRLLQKIQIKQGVLFITANKVYTSAKETTIV